MNDLKFAIRQLLKNPGFAAVAVLTLARASRSLSSKNPPDLPVIKAYFDDQVPAATLDVIARTVTDPPADLPRTGIFRDCDQALLEFDSLSSCAVVSSRHRSGQRQSQFVFQDRFIQSLWHIERWSGLRQDCLGRASFNDVTGWRDKIKERGYKHKVRAALAQSQSNRPAAFLATVESQIGNLKSKIHE